MTRDDLTALIARVEKVTWPNFTLEVDIAEAVGRRQLRLPTPAYPASLDAAMTLVPEGWFVMLGYQNGGQSAGASLTEYPAWQNRGRNAQGTAATPALALVAAALRARLAQMGDDA